MNLRPRPLRHWLVLTHLVVLLLPVVAVFLSGAWAWDLRQQTRQDLVNQGAILAIVVEDLLGEGTEGLAPVAPRVTDLLVAVKASTLAGIRLVDMDGRVVAASDPSHVGVDLSGEPEVRTALSGEVGGAVRPREDVGRLVPALSSRGPGSIASQSRFADVRVFVALPVVTPTRPMGAIVLSRTPREEVQALYQMSPRLIWGVALALVGTIGIAAFASRVFTRTLMRLASASERLAHAHFDVRSDLERGARSRVLEVASLAHSMQAMSDRLRDRLRYITEFAGNVSHEFRTPLATLQGTVELLKDDPEMPTEQRERFLHNAHVDIQRLTAIVQGLLELARAEEAADWTEVDLDAVLAGVAQRFPEATLVAGAGRVRGSASQLGAALDNLVRNALEHGGADVAVVIRGYAAAGITGFEVEDDGPGITEANLPLVFDRFFTTGRERGGTGLGLSIVHAVAVSHGGRATVTSRPGRTVFRVELPRLGA